MEWLSKLMLSLLLLLSVHSVGAQDEPIVVLNETDTIRPTKYIAPLIEQPKLALFQGFTLSADILGPIIYLLSDYGSTEAALRLNLKNTYFPIVEVGYGKCESTDIETNISYSTSAPFFRAGIDFNILKNKFMDNRLYVGARYGMSSFKFDMSGPAMTDPIWGGSSPYSYHNAKSTSSWMEVVFGVQVKIWRNFHMGWSVRYKQELHIGQPSYAKPYYIPGYGTTTDTSCWGGTYNLIFDLNWGKKKQNKTPLRPTSIEGKDE
jgi:hypothetical protein